MRNPLRGVFRKSVLERNQVVLGIVGLVLLVGGSAFALLLSGGVFADTYSVTARFSDAAGIRSGDDVTVAGLDAGSVGAVELADGTVAIELKINQDVDMPADARAEIVVETLLGKKSVSLVSGESGEALAEGDTIPLERTSTPVEVSDLNDASVALLERSDAQALEQLMHEVTSITKGKEQELRTLIDGLDQVSVALVEKRQELSRLLESLSTLATTFGENDDTIVSLVDRYDVVLGNLVDQRQELAVLLESTDSASHEMASLVDRNRPALDSALKNLHQALEVVADHQLDLAATIPYLEQAVRGYSSVGYSQGVPNRWANIFVQSLGPLGVDAIAGRCGLLDQALDQILGPDPRSCEDRSNYGGEDSSPIAPPGDDGGGASGKSQGGDSGSGAEEGDPADALPDDIGDLIDDVTGGALDGIGGLP